MKITIVDVDHRYTPPREIKLEYGEESGYGVAKDFLLILNCLNSHKIKLQEELLFVESHPFAIAKLKKEIEIIDGLLIKYEKFRILVIEIDLDSL